MYKFMDNYTVVKCHEVCGSAILLFNHASVHMINYMYMLIKKHS